MIKYIFMIFTLCTFETFAREFNPFEVTTSREADQINSNPMLMQTKPKANNKKKIDRNTGFYNMGVDEVVELDDSLVDDASEEKEVDKTLSEISRSITDELTKDKLEKVKVDINLENEALEDVETRYKKLKLIDSTPREPSETEEIEISPY